MKKVICLSVFAAAALLTWHSYNFASIGLDDANIYFKYAKNLANGFGFVYNPGGEHVEGFTSILWTVMVAGLYVIAGPGFEPILLALNFLLMAGTLLLLLRILD
ncbi:MAG TPA: hypothetical protein VLD19_15870, partial [Chitinophagaceae bacterium]|nr:hypothetical protein [Chitinophagaceae bacterium]